MMCMASKKMDRNGTNIAIAHHTYYSSTKGANSRHPHGTRTLGPQSYSQLSFSPLLGATNIDSAWYLCISPDKANLSLLNFLLGVFTLDYRWPV